MRGTGGRIVNLTRVVSSLLAGIVKGKLLSCKEQVFQFNIIEQKC